MMLRTRFPSYSSRKRFLRKRIIHGYSCIKRLRRVSAIDEKYHLLSFVVFVRRLLLNLTFFFSFLFLFSFAHGESHCIPTTLPAIPYAASIDPGRGDDGPDVVHGATASGVRQGRHRRGGSAQGPGGDTGSHRERHGEARRRNVPLRNPHPPGVALFRNVFRRGRERRIERRAYAFRPRSQLGELRKGDNTIDEMSITNIYIYIFIYAFPYLRYTPIWNILSTFCLLAWNRVPTQV